MRFLMLNWRDPRNPLAGGAERVTLAYWSALAGRGHETFWFANAFPGCLPEEVIEGVHIVRGGGKGSSILHARKWYRQQRPFDLVADQHHGIPWFAPWWCHTRCVAYIHEVLGPIWSAFYPWPISAFGRWQERWTHWLYRNVPFWTACESTRDQLHRHGVKQVTIIRYGVHTKAIEPLDDKPLTSPLRLIVVSRLAPNKRVDQAVRALPVLIRYGVPAELTIVGTGQCEPELRRLVGDLSLGSVVKFTGELPEAEKDRAMREAHLLLHTSQREGWGLNVIEANAMGTPAVVYPVAGLIESTIHDSTGLVADRETPEALADSLMRLSADRDRYQAYRRNAWNRAKEFHWSNVLPLACDWLESMAAGKGNQTGTA
ncbi:MAG: glycosyltransferase family 4 protein [Verrucomicrobiota bacterium]